MKHTAVKGKDGEYDKEKETNEPNKQTKREEERRKEVTTVYSKAISSALFTVSSFPRKRKSVQWMKWCEYDVLVRD